MLAVNKKPAKLQKAVEQAATEYRANVRATQPNPLTWCIRAALYARYGHRPRY